MLVMVMVVMVMMVAVATFLGDLRVFSQQSMEERLRQKALEERNVEHSSMILGSF